MIRAVFRSDCVGMIGIGLTLFIDSCFVNSTYKNFLESYIEYNIIGFTFNDIGCAQCTFLEVCCLKQEVQCLCLSTPTTVMEDNQGRL